MFPRDIAPGPSLFQLFQANGRVLRALAVAGAIDIEAVKDAPTGASVETARGTLQFREIDIQLGASAYFGRVADDPGYDFPIYTDLVEFKGPEIWRPESGILAARNK